MLMPPIFRPQIALALVGTIILVIIALYIIRFLISRGYEPKYVPTKYLKQKWRARTPASQRAQLYGPIPTNQAQLSEVERNQARSRSASARESTSAEPTQSQSNVDRYPSVRSIMTLPSYSVAPAPSEQVIAREGERAGMDVVVEFPETGEEEESRREDEMESLYQIRVARRREIAEREERRRERREARERGDWARVEELRRERTRAAAETTQSPNGSSTNLTAATLLAEHQSRGRDRRISSVSYADIGRVRHDGTRLRANSQDSDSRPLLDSPATMGGSHQRDRSTSSVISMSSNGSDGQTLRQGSTVESDIGESALPPPPQYDGLDWGEAPPYEPPPTEAATTTTATTATNNQNNEADGGVPNQRDGQTEADERNERSGRDENSQSNEQNPPQLPRLSQLQVHQNVPSIAISNATPPGSTPVTPVSPVQPPAQTHSPSSH